jgi:microcystin-dependent protein
MPSDANGVYSLPAGYLATPGAKIRPSQHNPIFEDVATAISDRVLKNGNTPMSGPLQAYAGNAATPGLTFNGSENFGFFKTANGIGVSVNGVQVAEFTASGVLKSSRYIGELIPWSRLTAPPLCVLPFGQTLSRVTFADLWTVAQAEIAVGNTFYNNGDGSTTFGIADLRGRGLAAPDNMGGTPAGRLTAALSGFVTTQLGSVGGAEVIALALANLPTGITSANLAGVAVSVASTVADILRGGVSDNFTSTAGSGQFDNLTKNTITSNGTIGIGGVPVTSNNTNNTPHQNVAPLLIANFALFAGA